MMVAVRPALLTNRESPTPDEFLANDGQVFTYAYLLRRLWSVIEGDGDVWPMRSVINTLRYRLRDDPVYPRVCGGTSHP